MFSFKMFLIIVILIIYGRPSYEQQDYSRQKIYEDKANKIIQNIVAAYKNKLLYYLNESNKKLMSAMECPSTWSRKFSYPLHKVEEFDFDFFVIEQDFRRIMNKSSADWNSVSHNYLRPQQIKDESQKVMDEPVDEVWNSKWKELKKEMNPTNLVQSFSLTNATKGMKKLINQYLGLAKPEGRLKKEVSNMINNQMPEQGLIQYAIEQLEFILDESVVKDFKLKQTNFFAKLIDLIKQKRENTENLGKLDKVVKRILEYSRIYWMNKFITLKSLLKSDPEKLERKGEIESLEEQPILNVLGTKFPADLLKMYYKQVDKLKQLNEVYRPIIIAKFKTYPQLLQPLSTSSTEKEQPSEDDSTLAKSNVIIRQLIYNYRRKIIKIVHDNIDKLTSLWYHSLQKGVSYAEFKQFYKNVNKEIKILIKLIDLDAALQELNTID